MARVLWTRCAIFHTPVSAKGAGEGARPPPWAGVEGWSKRTLSPTLAEPFDLGNVITDALCKVRNDSNRFTDSYTSMFLARCGHKEHKTRTVSPPHLTQAAVFRGCKGSWRAVVNARFQ